MVYESNTKERRILSRPAHAVYGPTTSRGPEAILTYVGEIKEVGPTPNAVFVAGLRTPGVLFAGLVLRRQMVGLALAYAGVDRAALCLFLRRAAESGCPSEKHGTDS